MIKLEAFFWGIITALGALFFELVFFIIATMFSPAAAQLEFAQFFALPIFILIAASIEELFKYLIILKRLKLALPAREYMTNALLLGLGFFATELVLIALSNPTLPKTQILVELALVHIGTCGLMGHVLSTQNPRKTTTAIKTLFLALFFHFSYNFLILQRTSLENYLVFALLAILLLANLFGLYFSPRKLA